MKESLLRVLRCPECRSQFDVASVGREDQEILEGSLRCVRCARSTPIIDAIPLFVPTENYAHSFGVQWNEFRQTKARLVDVQVFRRGHVGYGRKPESKEDQ